MVIYSYHRLIKFSNEKDDRESVQDRARAEGLSADIEDEQS